MSCNKQLKFYKNEVFVETGSGTGAGIASAIDNGFKEIHSIEIDSGRVQLCKARFQMHPEVHIYEGASRKLLGEVMDKITKPCTVLLDAHVISWDETHDNKLPCPVLEEIEIVLEHGDKHNLKHTILIDDARMFDGKNECFSNYTILDIAEIAKGRYRHEVINKGKYLVIT